MKIVQSTAIMVSFFSVPINLTAKSSRFYDSNEEVGLIYNKQVNFKFFNIHIIHTEV